MLIAECAILSRVENDYVVRFVGLCEIDSNRYTFARFWYLVVITTKMLQNWLMGLIGFYWFVRVAPQLYDCHRIY